MTGPGRTANATGAHAWALALEALERDVQAIEELVRAADGATGAPVPPAWQAPELPSPLPAELLDRARGLHHRQSQAQAALSTAIAANRADARRLASRPVALGAAVAPTAPAYVDVSA